MSSDPIKQQLTLYWNIISPYARAVKVLLDLSKLPHKLISVDLLNRQQHNKQFSDINPKKQVPVLAVQQENKKVIITQSVAIMVYLCEKYPEKLQKFYGRTLQEKANIMEYMSWIQFSFVHNIGLLWTTKRDYGLKFNKPIPEQKIKKAERKMQIGLKQLNQALQNKNFLVGDRQHPSIADILVYFLLTMLIYVGKDYFSYPNIKKFVKKIYRIQEIKTISHQWFSIAKQIAQFIEQLEISPVKPKL